MRREEVRDGDSEGARRKKKKWGEEVREFIVRKAKWAEENIFFHRSEEDNIYRSYTLCERDCFSKKKKKIVKQPIEYKHFFYKSFLLTKNSFSLTNLFFILPNTKKCGKLSL